MEKHDILLESGTNECEVLEFMVSNNTYGINVGKVREIIKYEQLTVIPKAHPHIEGAFSKRGETVSVVNLAKALGLPEMYDEHESSRLLLTSFNGVNTGFHINEVIGIRRVNWANIIQPDSMINSAADGLINGIVDIGDHLILMLDFEGIIARIAPDISSNITSQLQMLATAEPKNMPILYADDSRLIRETIKKYLMSAGFTNITAYSNGLELYKSLIEFKQAGTLKENVALIITDLEMPQMDGHRLLKILQEDSEMAKIPVIIFSSMVNENSKFKGNSVNAQAQFMKSDVVNLIKEIDSLNRKKQER